jgi:hypothetical protein
VTDPLTGLKAFKRRLINKLDLRTEGVELDAEIIAKLSFQNEYILELPVEYFPRLKMEGKKITIFDGIKTIYYLIKLRFMDRKKQ